MEILSTSGLTKRYPKITALDQLDFRIERGMVFGLLGPNGSGKTTTLGILLNVIQPTAGTYKWFGKAPSANSRKKIGAILEMPCFLPYMTASQSLRVIAEIKDAPMESIDRVLRVVGLYDRRNDVFKTFSLGMKQRLAIASALLADPPVLILDEPTNGLDPKGIVEIRELITAIAQSGKTIILASHLLDEVQKVCSDFMVLRKGKKLFQGSVASALLNQKNIEVGSPNLEQLKAALSEHQGVESLTESYGKCILKVNDRLTTTELSQFLFDKKIIINHLFQTDGSLEREFLAILKAEE